ncbi:unnamed protein product, partial [Didymodactylos carnosus]
MLLEEIPVEIWLEIFRYLGTIDLYRAFYNLNTRINTILSHIHLYFDLNADDECSPLIIYAFEQQIYSLRLSSNAITVFYSVFTLTQFNNLSKLKLVDILSEQYDHITLELLTLKHLKYLDLTTSEK